MEANRPGVMSTQRKCIRSSQGCMAAQVIFHYRCETTQVEIAISAGNHKSCFAVTVLRCDFLHDIIDGKCGKEAYTGGIACEQFAREGIDVVIRNGHAHQSISGLIRERWDGGSARNRPLRPYLERVALINRGFSQVWVRSSSKLRRSGVHPKVVSDILGHKVNLAMDVYDRTELVDFVQPLSVVSTELLRNVTKKAAT